MNVATCKVLCSAFLAATSVRLPASTHLRCDRATYCIQMYSCLGLAEHINLPGQSCRLARRSFLRLAAMHAQGGQLALPLPGLASLRLLMPPPPAPIRAAHAKLKLKLG
jgi:hypothetical protein